MPQIINTNIASLNAQRNLNKSQSQLGIALQRLSSGLRINSAKDDAAGLAISERFTTQIRGINQAIRNSNDGISLAQTAEGDLAQITNNLQRIRELAVQSANATNSTSDRAALQLEAAQLISEIDRVASTSAFNGVKLLDGTFATQQFQVGANAGETVSIASIASARTDNLGQAVIASTTGGAVSASGIAAGDLTINGTAVAATSGDASLIAAAISAVSTDVTATATNTQNAIVFGDVTGTAAAAATPGQTGLSGAFVDPGLALGETYSLTVDGTLIFSQTGVGAIAGSDIDSAISALDGNTDGIIDSTAGSANELSYTGTANAGTLRFSTSDGNDFDVVVVNDAAANGFGGADFATGTNTVTNGTPAVTAVAPTYSLSIDGTSLSFAGVNTDGVITGTEVAGLIDALSGYTASFSGGNLTVTKADGSNFVLAESGSDSANAEGLAGGTGVAVNSATYRGVVTVNSQGQDLVVGGNTPGNAGLSTGTTAGSGLTGTTITNVDISDTTGANSAISAVDNALTTINSSRANLGAIQNRFESVVSSLSTSVENLSAARSRIRDADFAEETAALTRTQILQQAGVAILSQANALPQLALSLLQ